MKNTQTRRDFVGKGLAALLAVAITGCSGGPIPEKSIGSENPNCSIPEKSIGSGESVEFYDLYSPEKNMHFYTTSEKLEEGFMAYGGFDRVSQARLVKSARQGIVPLYRYLKENNSSLSLTTDKSERDRAVESGAIDGEIMGYIFSAKSRNTLPLFRMSFEGREVYALGEKEEKELKQKGWSNKGLIGYLLNKEDN